MKLLTYNYQQQACIGVLDDDKVALPSLDPVWQNRYSDLLTLINAGDSGLAELREWFSTAHNDSKVALDKASLLAPIPRPSRNIICLGWNYLEHVKETKGHVLVQKDIPKYPIVFTKDVSTVHGPYQDIPYDAEVSAKIDWEAELAVVIGRYAHKVSKEQALDYVFGYTVVNDISARDLQKRHGQFFIGKSLPGSCPMGPSIVTADDISDVQALTVQSRLNGVIKQDSSTKNQIFDVTTVISVISQVIPLDPGTIISTGTPSGVGYTRDPPEYLVPGDLIECEVSEVGVIANRVV